MFYSLYLIEELVHYLVRLPEPDIVRNPETCRAGLNDIQGKKLRSQEIPRRSCRAAWKIPRGLLGVSLSDLLTRRTQFAGPKLLVDKWKLLTNAHTWVVPVVTRANEINSS